MSLLFTHFSTDPPYSFSSLTWPLTAHFFCNSFFLLHISPWTPNPFLVCHIWNHAPLCFISLLCHCPLQVRQKHSPLQKISSNSALTTSKGPHLPAKQCYSVENIAHTISNKPVELQRPNCFPPLIVMDYTETERFCFTQEAKGGFWW